MAQAILAQSILIQAILAQAILTQAILAQAILTRAMLTQAIFHARVLGKYIFRPQQCVPHPISRLRLHFNGLSHFWLKTCQLANFERIFNFWSGF